MQALSDIADEGVKCLRCADVQFLRTPLAENRAASAQYGIPIQSLHQGRVRCPDCNPERPKGIPIPRLSDTFDSFNLKLNPAMQRVYARCLAVGEGREWCALLSGGYGIGKTHLAIAALIRYGKGRFVKVPDLLNEIRMVAFGDRGVTSWGAGEDAAIDPYRNEKGLLVLDDLGAEKDTDWTAQALYRILDARYDANLPTIITTNHAADRIDGRIWDRFRQGLATGDGDSKGATE